MIQEKILPENFLLSRDSKVQIAKCKALSFMGSNHLPKCNKFVEIFKLDDLVVGYNASYPFFFFGILEDT